MIWLPACVVPVRFAMSARVALGGARDRPRLDTRVRVVSMLDARVRVVSMRDSCVRVVYVLVVYVLVVRARLVRVRVVPLMATLHLVQHGGRGDVVMVDERVEGLVDERP